MTERQHGTRMVREHNFVDDLMATVSGGQRIEILTVLADGPLNVTTLAKTLYLSIGAVSRDLEHLNEAGLVRWNRVKTNRIYHLTERVRPLREKGTLQLVIVAGSGRWILVSPNDCDAEGLPISPPETFVDAKMLRKQAG